MAMDQAQTFEWLRHRVYNELEPEVADLRAQLAAATARIERLTAQRAEKDDIIRDHRAEVERLTANAPDSLCWETDHTYDVLMGDGTTETRHLPKTHCPVCVDAAMSAAAGAVRQELGLQLAAATAEQAQMRADLEAIVAAIPATFYAGTDPLFRVVQLVRIWQGAVKANQTLGMDLEAARARVAELEESVSIGDKLLTDRNRVLDALPCGAHGRCIPHALDEIERLKQVEAREKTLREALDWIHGACGDRFTCLCGRPTGVQAIKMHAATALALPPTEARRTP